MAREQTTIQECGHHYPIEIASISSAEGSVFEDVAPSIRLAGRYLP